MIRRFIKKCKKEKIIEKFKDKQRYTKPSVAKKEKQKRAIRREEREKQKKIRAEERRNRRKR
jgi:ribosomal protein S21